MRDLSILASAIIRDFPGEYKRLYSHKEYTYNKITQPNRNRLLWVDPNVDGMKTGHTESAGYCLISSARRGDMRLLSVLVGAPSDTARATESQKLLNYGFQFYETRVIYKPGQTVSQFKLWKGEDKTVVATVPADVALVIPKGRYKDIKATVTSQQPLVAPLSKGQVIGSIQFTLDGKPLYQQNLVTSKEIVTAGLFRRLWDGLLLMF